ncbi:MAG: hypothetical protein LBI15_02305 [Dysgonamonadaceae bacterium]|nr:hypothetical protein [Dysgonamonadaceae bacterium]
MKIHYKIVASLILFSQILFANNIIGNERITARYLDDRAIVVTNNTGYDIYIFRRDSRMVNTDDYMVNDGRRSYSFEDRVIQDRIHTENNLTTDIILRAGGDTGAFGVSRRMDMTLHYYYRDDQTIRYGGRIEVYASGRPPAAAVTTTPETPPPNTVRTPFTPPADTARIIPPVTDTGATSGRGSTSNVRTGTISNNQTSPTRQPVEDNNVVDNSEAIIQGYEAEYRRISNRYRLITDETGEETINALLEESVALHRKIEQETNERAKERLKEVSESLTVMMEGINNILSNQKEDMPDNTAVTTEKTEITKSSNFPNARVWILIVIFLLTLPVVFLYVKANYKKKKKTLINRSNSTEDSVTAIDEVDEMEGIPAYVSGLGEIYHYAKNDYYAIDMNTLFDHTTIQTVYLSRKFVQDIYKFFSDSLKISGKINETGCFAIGRWELIPSENQDTYNISLEEIVLPGSDAVYGEYTLDFGGQIGISLESKIMAIRQNTGNEYVHTAWLHSHPGFGLFLSTHDISVQSQLQYSDHPNRLLAIVIDNNTDNLNMGLFSPKKDGSINNNDELKKELSLEKIHQWAKKSVDITMQSDDYFVYSANGADSCIKYILFTGTAIIDIDHSINADLRGIAGCFYGKSFGAGIDQKTIIIEKYISTDSKNSDDGSQPVGYLVVESEFSYRDIIQKYRPTARKYDFFIVYVPETDMLHIVAKNSNDTFSVKGDKTMPFQLLDMKKWTRRRR